MIGKTISHYKILEKLGAGGMGEVYLADDLSLERKVAIKILPQNLTKNETNVERFRREAKAAAALNHPNIVTIHEIIETDDPADQVGRQICIVMEHVEGQTLRELMTADGQLPIANVISIACQIASGLNVAHNTGVVHRDIKPENILINQKGQVKILDFGLAKLKGASNLTQENSTLGTIHYMSPEQTKGEDVDHRSDIWSLGVVLYEMTTGLKPFKGDYEQAIIYSIMNEELDDFAVLPAGIGSIIDKCLKKNPEDRYQNIDKLEIDLKQCDSPDETILIEKSDSGQNRSTIWKIVSIILAIVIAGYFAVKLLPSNSQENEPWLDSIAVMPFDDLSPEKNQEHFCLGMTEQILFNLAKLNDLKVIARASVMKYQNTQKSISEIAYELDVNNLLEGSIQRAGEKVRIHVQLINAATGAYLWSENYDSDLQDLFSVQDEVSQKVAAALNFNLRIRDTEAADVYQTANTDAYEYYLKGEYLSRYYILSQKLDDHYDLFELAEDHFKKSLQFDPNFTRAKLGLVEHYLSYTFLHGDEGLLKLANQYSDEVLSSDPKNDYAIALKGGYYYETGELETAYSYFKQALSLNPNSGKANYYLAQFYVTKGLFHQAKNHFEKAVQIDPLNTLYLFECGLACQELGLFNKAEKYFRKLLEFNPDHVLGRWILFWNSLYLGKYDEAERFFTEHMQMFPDFDLNSAARASLFAAKGEKEKSLKITDSSVNNYLLLDMKEKAVDILIDQVKNPESNNYTYLVLMHGPIYDRIRDNRRFQKIIAQQKVIYEDNLKKYGEPDID